jgi:hypothetical protein
MTYLGWIAGLARANAGLKSQLRTEKGIARIAVSQVVQIERQRDALLAFVNGKISRAEMERRLSKMEGVTLL